VFQRIDARCKSVQMTSVARIVARPEKSAGGFFVRAASEQTVELLPLPMRRLRAPSRHLQTLPETHWSLSWAI
jgi:hypothetical protein